MDKQYADREWLIAQLASGKSEVAIAAECNVAFGTIHDRVIKFDLTNYATQRPLRRWSQSRDNCAHCLQDTYKESNDDLCLQCAGQVPAGTQAQCAFCTSSTQLDYLPFDRMKIGEQSAWGCVCPACYDGVGHLGDSLLKWCGKNRRRIPPQVLHPIAINAKILVLGATGFVGQNLMRYFKSCTLYRAIAADRMDYDASKPGSVYSLIKKTDTNVVVNLAAFVGGIGLNARRPGDMFIKNMNIITNVIEDSFAAGVQKLIELGTICSYPHTPNHIPFREEDIWYGRPEPTNEPYGVAKKAGGIMLEAYKKQFNFRSAWLIPTNLYGPGDHFDLQSSHVIPALIRKIYDAKEKSTETHAPPVTIWGSGHATREFLYVEDMCHAIGLAIARVDDPTPINIGSNSEINISTIAHMIAEIVGYQGDFIYNSSKPDGQPRRSVDASRAKEVMGFEAKTSLRDGLIRTVEYYITHGRPGTGPVLA